MSSYYLYLLSNWDIKVSIYEHAFEKIIAMQFHNLNYNFTDTLLSYISEKYGEM